METVVPPTLPDAAAKPKAKWWKIVVAVLGGGILLLGVLARLNSVALEVRRIDLMFRDDGKVLEITNVGKTTISITGVIANDRTDCRLTKLALIQGQERPYPIQLKIGETQSFAGTCRVVRATVETDQGSESYTFSR